MHPEPLLSKRANGTHDGGTARRTNPHEPAALNRSDIEDYLTDVRAELLLLEAELLHVEDQLNGLGEKRHIAERERMVGRRELIREHLGSRQVRLFELRAQRETFRPGSA